jgi:hypothetical protein
VVGPAGYGAYKDAEFAREKISEQTQRRS